jgi:hypothetical protein
MVALPESRVIRESRVSCEHEFRRPQEEQAAIVELPGNPGMEVFVSIFNHVRIMASIGCRRCMPFQDPFHRGHRASEGARFDFTSFLSNANGKVVDHSQLWDSATEDTFSTRLVGAQVSPASI